MAGRDNINAQNNKITLYIEKCRVEKGLGKSDLARQMGINKDIYRRRLHSDGGFTEEEINAAGVILGFDVKAEIRL